MSRIILGALLATLASLAVASMLHANVPVAVPTPEKCWGYVRLSDWTLICQNPCIPDGCNRATVSFDPTPGQPGDEFDVKVCICQGHPQVCCDVGEPVEGSGAAAYGSCNGVTCPAGECVLDITEEDITASCHN